MRHKGARYQVPDSNICCSHSLASIPMLKSGPRQICRGLVYFNSTMDHVPYSTVILVATRAVWPVSFELCPTILCILLSSISTFPLGVSVTGSGHACGPEPYGAFDRTPCASAPWGPCTGSLSRMCFATRGWFASASCASAPSGPCSGSRCSSYVCYSLSPVLP